MFLRRFFKDIILLSFYICFEYFVTNGKFNFYKIAEVLTNKAKLKLLHLVPLHGFPLLVGNTLLRYLVSFNIRTKVAYLLRLFEEFFEQEN